MPSILHTTVVRSLAAAAAVSVAALAIPANSHAQSGYAGRALLNRVPTPSVLPSSAWRPAVFGEAIPASVSGERALLVRSGLTAASIAASTSPAALAEPVDGSRALLGRGSGGQP